MKFKDYLISKRNIIILLMCINCFALGVNMLEIKGEFKDEKCPDYIFHNLFCSGRDEYNARLSQQNFWPFVEYFHWSDRSYYCGGGSRDEFKGVFRYFDYSEFIIYSLLMLLVFYLRWESSKKSK